MINKKSRSEVRAKKHRRLRNRISGTASTPRLAVFRSNNHMYAQIIDDTVGKTLVSASTVQKEVKAELEKTNDVAAAAHLGTVIAKRAIEKVSQQLSSTEEVSFTRVRFRHWQMQPVKLVLISKQGGYNMKRELIDASQLELEETVVSIKRVTKVVKGGRNMRFAALVVVGDKNGHVGAGLGKAIEIPEAIRKGKEDAMKKLVKVPVNEVGSIPHDFIGKFGSAEVLLKASPEGTGIIAGGPSRAVLELAGYKNIRSKALGSNNKQNVVLATIAGLKEIKTPEEVARLRGKSVDEL